MILLCTFVFVLRCHSAKWLLLSAHRLIHLCFLDVAHTLGLSSLNYTFETSLGVLLFNYTQHRLLEEQNLIYIPVDPTRCCSCAHLHVILWLSWALIESAMFNLVVLYRPP